MYGLRSSPKAWLCETEVRTQRLHQCNSRLLHHGLRGRPVGTWSQDYCRLHLRGHPEAGTAQARWLPQFRGRNIERFGNCCTLHRQHDQGDWNDQLQHGDRFRNRHKPTIEDEALLDHEQHTSMVSIHKTRHCLRNKRTSARPHSTYRTFTKESQAPTTLLARHQTLQVHHRTNNNRKGKHQQHPGSRRSCRR